MDLCADTSYKYTRDDANCSKETLIVCKASKESEPCEWSIEAPRGRMDKDFLVNETDA